LEKAREKMKTEKKVNILEQGERSIFVGWLY